MSTRAPIIRQIAWISLVPQLIILAILIYLVGIAFPELLFAQALQLSAVVYLAYSLFSRYIIARHHRQGIRHMKFEKYPEAIKAFESSLVFFSKHKFLDKYRYITLLSGSAAPYREMALCNIGFAYSQIGDGAKARRFYEQALKEFPNSGLAKATLRLMESMKHKDL